MVIVMSSAATAAPVIASVIVTAKARAIACMVDPAVHDRQQKHEIPLMQEHSS
jgi:hypothetical protein